MAHAAVVPVQVVVGDAAVPVGSGRAAGDVVHGLEHEGNRARGQQRRLEVIAGEPHAAVPEIVEIDRQRLAVRREHDPLEPGAQGLAARCIAEHRPQVAQRRAHPTLASQHMPAARGDDMQPIARMPDDRLDVPVEEGIQLARELPAHQLGAGQLAPRLGLVALVDVVVREALEEGCSALHRAGGHAPGADRGADEMHGVAALRHPAAEELPVEMAEDESLGAAGRAGHHADVLRLQAAIADVPQGPGAGVDLECSHALGPHGRGAVILPWRSRRKRCGGPNCPRAGWRSRRGWHAPPPTCRRCRSPPSRC